MQRTLDKHLDSYCLVILAILAYVLFFHQLSGIGFVGPDEPRYAAVAREMFESGDYVTPRLLGETWFEKPVLLYWLAAAGYAVFGVGETGARLPSALAASVSVFAMFWCGRKIYSRGAGMAAALILATSAGFLGLARAASTDMLLSAALTVALASFLIGYHAEGRERRWYFYAFYAALGLGVLAKGPIAIFLPAAALVVFSIWRCGPGEWRGWHPEGAAITLLVGSPWYLAVSWIHGWDFVRDFFLNHNFQRFTTDVYGHDQPFYFFVPVFLLMMFPWTPLLIPAVRRRLDKDEHLMFAWAAVPFLFFSMSGSKLPAYILPMAAPVALLLAGEIAKGEPTRRFKVASVLEAVLWIGLGLIAVFLGDLISVDVPIGNGTGLLILTLVIAVGLLAIALAFPPPALGAFNVAVVAGLVLVVTGLVFPNAQAVESMRPWATELDDFVSSGEEVLLYKPPRWMEYGLGFYRAQPATTVASEEQLLEITDSGTRFFCISETRTLDELSASDRIAIEVVEAMGSQTAFWVWQP